MDTYRLQSLLQNTLGNGKKSSKDEILFYCPFCSHHNPKLSVNTRIGYWKCWVCDSKGKSIVSLMKQINADAIYIKEAREIQNSNSSYVPPVSIIPNTSITLPKEFISLAEKSTSVYYKHAMIYLEKRNITQDDIIKYNIGYCEEGWYSNRIIVPSYDETIKLNYFTGRLFFDGTLKYLNPSDTKNVIIFESLISWTQPIVICEGVFDAIAIKRNAIPILGKTINQKLKEKLLLLDVPIFIVLDKDAESSAVNIATELSSNGKDVRIVDLPIKDPSELGFQEVNKLIENTPKISSSELFKRKVKLGVI